MPATEQPEPGRPSVASRLMKVAAAVVSAGLLVIGAKAIAKSDPPSSSGVAGPQSAETVSNPGAVPPAGVRPRMGAAVTGATLDRLKSLVTARYPGTIERADKLPDGSYIVHVIRSNRQELHVHVTKDFRIAGTDQGRWGHGDGARPRDGLVPGGPPPPGNPS